MINIDELTQEEWLESEHCKLLMLMLDEQRKLVMVGNKDGTRVRELHSITLYNNGEVYSHGVHPQNRDYVLLLGALQMQTQATYREQFQNSWKAIHDAGACELWPPPRAELERGYRFGSNVRGILERGAAAKSEDES